MPETSSGRKFPPWIKVRGRFTDEYQDLKRLMGENRLHSVCEEAKCPNIFDCWSRRTATFLMLGDVCTRACGFCGIATGRPNPCDPDEPRRVAESIKRLGLRHAVITSVNRDDLEDGGAQAFHEVIATMRDIRAAGADILTIGQYLRPSTEHLPVRRFWRPEEFEALAREGLAMGFGHVESGPLVRSSYHADEQVSRVPGAPPALSGALDGTDGDGIRLPVIS